MLWKKRSPEALRPEAKRGCRTRRQCHQRTVDPDDEADLDSEADSPYDPQFDEGLAVLQDYIKLLATKTAKPSVVLKDK